jgi:hypothetical protein
LSLRCLILLEVLVRSGKRTTSNALWGSASDLAEGHREAERMLQALAVKGHLEATVEHGRLHFALWKYRAPP